MLGWEGKVGEWAGRRAWFGVLSGALGCGGE